MRRLWTVTSCLWLVAWVIGGFTDLGALGCATATYALAKIEEE